MLIRSLLDPRLYLLTLFRYLILGSRFHFSVHADNSLLTTSRSFFSKCPLTGSARQNIEYLKQTVPLRKVIASFDIAKNVSFFKLETCQSYVICFVTKSDVIRKDDFGRSNVEIWTKLVTAFEGKALLEPFKEERHRDPYGRSSLEASCTDGYFVIRHARYSSLHKKRRKKHSDMSSSKGSRTGRKRHRGRKSGRGTGKGAKRKRRNKKKSKVTFSKECQEDNSLCLRTCVGWAINPQECIRLRISCSFYCEKAKPMIPKKKTTKGLSDDR